MARPFPRIVSVWLGARWLAFVRPALLGFPAVCLPPGIDCVFLYPHAAIAVCAWIGKQAHEYHSDGKYVIRDYSNSIGRGYAIGFRVVPDGAARHAALYRHMWNVSARFAGISALP